MKKIIFGFYLGIIGMLITGFTIALAALNPWYVDGESGIWISLVQNKLIFSTIIGIILVIVGGIIIYKEQK